MSRGRPILCPRCERDWRAQGKLANMVANCTCSNPCDVCGSHAWPCTQYMDAAERVQFDARAEEKAKKFSDNKT